MDELDDQERGGARVPYFKEAFAYLLPLLESRGGMKIAFETLTYMSVECRIS